MVESGFTSEELRKFSTAGRMIAGAIGVSVEFWARGEAGIILKRWAGETKVATPEKTKGRSRLSLIKDYNATSADANPGGVTINAGARSRGGSIPGVVWVRGRNRKFRAAGRITDTGSLNWSIYHLADYQWSVARPLAGAVAGKMAHAIQAGLRTIGLGRQSIIQIADALGIDLGSVPGRGVSAAGIAKARAALASNGRSYVNGLGIETRRAAEFFIDLINSYPLAERIGLGASLERIIRGRIAYSERNLDEGTFLSARATARAYPYVEVLRLAA